jgi:hypothetical protein
MAPKADTGKTAKSAEAERLAALRRKHIVFPSTLTRRELRERYYLFWSAETKAHPGTQVFAPSATDLGPNKYPFFTVYFYCGLCPPFSEFFCDIMNTYGFHLLDFTPNAVLTMAIFAHLCENFAGVNPSTALFRHYFIPRVEKGEPLSGGIAWISRTGKKDMYLKGELRGRWDDWRSDWCWIVEEDPPSFTAPRKAPVVRGKDWSELDPEEKKFAIAITRIQRLRLAGLTVGMVGADFLRRRIAPLQDRKRPAWDFKNAADIMRLRPGLNYNFTVLELEAMLQELFKWDPEHPEWFRLPQTIVPLCNNSSLSRIISMMPLFDSHGLDPTWKVPGEMEEREFFDNLVERPINKDEKKGLTRDTTDAELARIATRAEEARAAAEAGEFGFTVEEAEAARAASLAVEGELAEGGELAGQDESAGPSEPPEETHSSSTDGSSSEEDLPQAETPAPQRKRIRKLGDVAKRQEDQQPPRRTTRSTAARTGAAGAPHTTTATGAGSSKTAAAAPAKRQRGPTPPPPPRTETRARADFDFSAFSSGEEEEEE